MASHSLMSPVLLNLCGTIERESGRVGQPQHNDNTVPGSHGMGSILDWCWFHVRSIFAWFPLDFRSVLVCCSLVLAWFSFDVRSILVRFSFSFHLIFVWLSFGSRLRFVRLSFGSRLLFVVGSFKTANPSCRAIAGPTGGGYSVIYRCMSLDVGCSLTLWLPSVITGCGCPTRLLWELECQKT